jgi:Ca2+-binding RTX toxin-like protein
VTVTITGVANQFDWLAGDGTDNTISGTAGDDFFFVSQGGDDDLSGLGGNDVFFFGGAMTSADEVDGGDGVDVDVDQIALQGNYSGGLTFGANVLDVENLAILPGNDTRFGDSGANFYDYNITLLDANVAAGLQMVIDANRLRVGEDFTFNGSAETDGSFFIYGGGGTDNLTGSANDDVFLFGAQGQWGASDVVNGGPGLNDQLALRGDYTVTFGAGQLVGVEQIGLVSALDTRFGALGDRYDYNLTMNDANVVGIQMTVDGAPLRSDETLTFNGSAEDDGSFRVFGGAGVDTIIGSQNADILVGNLGADSLTGGGGADTFVYRTKDDSPAGGNRDGIQDFSSLDIIDLTKVDAIDGGLDDAFTFIGTANFGNVAGQLRATISSGPIWLVQGDTDGDGDADLEFFVTITNNGAINAGDFML